MMTRVKVYLSNKEICNIIKDANIIVDALEGLDTKSPKYGELIKELDYTLDILYNTWRKDFQLHLSKKTKHYFITFAK